MKKGLLFLLLFLSLQSFVQQDSPSTATLGIGQDSFLGFYLTASGSYSLLSKKSVTFYANYWANPAFGNALKGTEFWTEIGGGLNFALLQGQFNINPTLGVTYEKVLSEGTRGVLGDGILAGLSSTFNNSTLEISAGGVWFKTLRKEGPVTVDYLWFWFVPVYKVSKRVTAGLHVEDFFKLRMTEASSTNLYL